MASQGRDAQFVDGSDHDVVFRVQNDKGLVRLNRPQRRNALSHSMLRRMRTFLEFSEKQNLDFVLVEGVGGSAPAFCSGSDFPLIDNASATTKLEYFRELYQLSYVTTRLRIPLISIVDGVATGSGAGMAMCAEHRIATQNAAFSTPDVKIGLIPDNGASSFLPGLGPLGMYLGLTGEKLVGRELLDAGLMAHFCAAESIKSLENALMQVRERSGLTGVLAKYEAPRDAFNKVNETPDPDSLATILPWVEETFNGKSVEEIILKLRNIQERRPSSKRWAQRITLALTSSNPTSLKLAHKLMTLGKEKDLKNCLENEFRVVSRICAGNDLAQGVRARFEDEGRDPGWSVQGLESVTESSLEEYFAPLPEELFARRSLFEKTDKPKVAYLISAAGVISTTSGDQSKTMNVQ